MKTTLGAFVTIASIALLAGCSSQSKSTETTKAAEAPKAVTVANTKCPVSGKATNPEMTADWNGQKVAFCCAGCKGTWAKLSDADKQAKLAAAK